MTGTVLRLVYEYEGRQLSQNIEALGLVAVESQRLAFETLDVVTRCSLLVRPDEAHRESHRAYAIHLNLEGVRG